MPIKKCTIDGQDGYKWGDQGKCYIGEEGKKKALAQGLAIGEIKMAAYADYPQAATNNAKRALKWVEENGWGSCGEATGKQRANQLANRENISRDTIARMASFQRHQQHKDVPYSEGCGGLMWDAWGGTAGIEWAQRKLKEIDNVKLSSSKKISFDYDGVVSTVKGKELIRQKITERNDVYIITARMENGDNTSLFNVAKELGINNDHIFFTNHKDKWETIQRLGIQTHYDNNQEQIDKINTNTKSEGIRFELSIHQQYNELIIFMNNDNKSTK